jgi:hypothetical protein
LSSFVKLLNESNANSSGLLVWKKLVSINDEEFANLFNNAAGIGKQYEQFTKNELGELRNMILRIDEITEVKTRSK